MDEKRIFERNAATFYAEITRSDNGHLVGHLADISLSGMMTTGDALLTAGDKFQPTVELPRNGGPARHVEILARVCWSRPDLEADVFVSGFEFLSGTAQNAENVAVLYRELGVMV